LTGAFHRTGPQNRHSERIVIMQKAQKGDTVRVHYTGRLTDETVFDSSQGKEPLEVTIGEGKLIPGFEKQLVGMQVGETKSLEIEPEEAYGTRNDQLTTVVQRTDLPKDLEPEVGQRLQVTQPDGSAFVVQVTEMDDASVTLDANHPLAGETLKFDIELTEIK
jgi:FKBP-type peptidyl-prolyl cis-trans isomerase 2